ncbi:MAG TPA: RraA family protein [Dongiaceae bacterium]|jgi:regulator of RNase E activity RraA|nr:RraA family protein [Dongiaceae bacterium]
MEQWRRAASELSSAVVLDALDEFGHRRQAILNVSPRTTGAVIVGRAKTMLWVDFAYDDPNTYALELAAVDSIQPHDLVVCATASSNRAGIWGELLTTAALQRGAAGIVTDGAVRDLARLEAMGFPVFARHLSPYDSMNRQKVVAHDVPVEIDGTRVAPGDVVIADRDGAAVVPQDVAAQVLAAALAKVRAENKFRDAVKGGMSLTEAYAKFKVL